jgi:phospholipid/cholesterol/gamma-HCH transport system substrate-binding protein
LIGDKLLELQLTKVDAPPVHDGDSIASVPPPNYTAIFDEARSSVKNAEHITSSLDTFLLRLRRGEGTLGKLITDESAYQGLVKITHSADRLLTETGDEFRGMSTTLNKASNNLDEMTLESKRLIGDISKGKGTFGALMYDRSLYDSLQALAGTLNEAAGSAGFAAREFGINMRGLRSNWLVGGLFGGGEDEKNTELQQKMLQIQTDELRRQKELLDQREREMMEKEQKDGEQGSLHK